MTFLSVSRYVTLRELNKEATNVGLIFESDILLYFYRSLWYVDLWNSIEDIEKEVNGFITYHCSVIKLTVNWNIEQWYAAVHCIVFIHAKVLKLVAIILLKCHLSFFLFKIRIFPPFIQFHFQTDKKKCKYCQDTTKK